MYLEYEFEDIKEKNWTVKQLDKRAKEVTKRRDALNQNFEWSEKNVVHLKKLFAAVNALQNTMYDEVVQMKKDFDELANAGVEIYRNYDIEAHIHLKRGLKLPFADDYLLSFMEYFSEFDFNMTGVHASSDYEMRSKEDQLNMELNWNIEIFDYFRKKDDKDPYIPYIFHIVWQDSDIYSLEDLLYMEPEDFVICKEVNFC